MIRPEALVLLRRWREVAGAAALALLGAWFIALGGWILGPAGGLCLVLSAGWAVIALRRMRFLRATSAPGVVEVDEGQVGYLGPAFGGFVSLRELVDLRIVQVQGMAQWRLKQADGQVLLIPVEAKGSAALFDAFASLPGIDMGALAAALDRPAGASMDAQALWRRPSRAALT